ncbi:amino acid adenylation domain-containing protein [Micromonospora sp. NPDC003816]|uniref:hybrid non-ribosomal peptide synthetase/type I polyketide synthase n=1 Tax=Micromonospora sp. NPDC003816 TaxID=3364224 RepID=UPI0036A61173
MTGPKDRQAILVESLREIRRLRDELDATRAAATEPVAIVGMACRMPGGVRTPDQFWHLLDRGEDAITEVPASRWDVDRYYDPSPETPGTMYTRRGGFLDDIDQFDAAFFGISQREAAWLDPQQRLLLEVGWEAVEDSGQAPDGLAGSATGVWFGVTTYDYCQRQMREVDAATLEAYALTSNASTFAAGRLSYWLGLTGPSLSVDTACSSSLVAVHLACQSLRSGETSMALAGGVNVLLAPEWSVVASRARMLAPDGRCKTFDAAADGYVRSEGCGVVVLKRLSDALAQGDRVLAVIRGSAVNQDGRSGGITVPNGSAQQEVIRAALRAASVRPEEVGYLEAHGTGTPLGDPIELRAADAVLGRRDPAEPLLVGSVKTNIGHLEPAAGIAGLIKVVLSLRHQRIPAHLHLHTVNPDIGLDEMALEIPTTARDWRSGDRPRIAGLSSFGASGTNAHLIVAEGPPEPVAAPDESPRTAHLLPLSARSPQALDELAGRYEALLAEPAGAGAVADVCHSAATGRAHLPYRLTAVGTDAAHLRDQLRAARAGRTAPGLRRDHARPHATPGVVFLLTGQGAQYPGMADLLYRTEPVFRQVIDECAELLRPLLDTPLQTLLAAAGPTPVAPDAVPLHDTRNTQPALFAVEYALAALWRSWGIVPAALLGHSVGELVAACLAGVFDLADGLRLATRRGQLMHTTAAGAMANVSAPPARLEPALAPYAGRLSVAAVNGPADVVVSGEPAALATLLDTLESQGIRSKRLTTTRGFHSPLMDPVLAEFEREAGTLTYHPPRIPVLSNVTGTYHGADGFSARYLREHVRGTVRFADAARTLLDDGHTVFLEVGPAPVLAAMVRRIDDAPVGDRPRLFLPSLRKGHDDCRTILDSLGALHSRGVAVDWTTLGRGRRRVPVPTSVFRRERHWYPAAEPGRTVPTDRAGETTAAVPDTASRSLLGRRVPSPLDVVQFESRLDAARHPCLGDCVMDGLPVVNIGVYLEAALAAVRHLRGPGPIEVTDCTVTQSLVLEHGRAVDAHLLVEPDATGHLGYRYYAAHPDSDADPTWVLHSRGHAGLLPPSAPESPVDLAALRADLAGELTGAEFYRRMWHRKLYLGPSAQWVDHVWQRDGEAVARMRAGHPGETDDYLLHPGLTDAMFQALFACLPADRQADAAYLLVGIERFRFHGMPAYGGESYCHVRLLPTAGPATLHAEVRLYDDAGRAVVSADGVLLKRAGRENLRRTDAPAPRAVVTAAPTVAASPPPTAVPTGALDRSTVEKLVADAVARALGAADGDGLDRHEPVQNLGLDSLMALEVKEGLSAALGVSLPMVAFLDGSSIVSLAETAHTRLGGAASTDRPAPAGRPESTTVRPAPADRYAPFPLTDLQQAYLVGRSDAFELGNTSTYFFLEVDIEQLDVDRLGAALRRMVDRHDMLRAVVSPEGHQRVLPQVPPYRIRVVDLRAESDRRRDERLDEIRAEMTTQVFDTTVWPLFDVRATRVDAHRTRLHFGFDALIIDAWSTSMLFRELAAAYRGDDASLPPLELTFRDYVLAREQEIGGPRHTEAREYWMRRLEHLPPAPELPLATSPAQVDRPVFTHRSARLDTADWTRFKQFATARGVTASAALCTAYAQVLAAWSKSSRFTLNVLFFNRAPVHPDVSRMLGNFSTTSLLEVDSTRTDDFGTRAVRVQRQLWSDLEHSQFSGVQVLRELNAAGGGSARATMPVVFASTVNFAAKDDGAAATGLAQHLLDLGSGGREVASSIRTPQVWLDHQVVEDAGALVVNWDVIEELFPAGMIDAMFDAYVGTLRDLCRDESTWRRPAPVLTPETDLAVRRAVNATTGPVPTGLLHAPFLQAAARYPDRPAVITTDRRLTYRELDRRSDRVAQWLADNAAGPGTLVGVVMEKGWEQIVAVIGVLKAGATYVPVDAHVPPERLRLLLDSAAISLVLTQSWVEERTRWPEGVVRTTVDTLPAGRTRRSARARQASPDSLAYVIFTSGSTGLPKGVMITHTSARNTIDDVNERFGVTAEDRVLALSALNFDLSVYDVFGLLGVGGAVVLPPPEAQREPERWCELVTTHRVTIWNSVPALAEMFAEHVLTRTEDRPIPLRVVMMSGDWIPVTLPDRLRQVAPQADLWSLGGATEAAIWSILYPIDAVDPRWASVPYGLPMRNQQFHVLNDALQPCPVWVTGDLYIGGVGLAQGYLNDDERTRAAFVRHPLTGERLYRTGDLGRYLPDGLIEFLGREDFQVKVQGYRIELGEIEAALSQCEGVRSAAVVAHGARQGAKRLHGYVVLDPDHADPDHAEPGEIAVKAIDQALRRMLPEYMVPQHLTVLDELPMSANGKIDRSALPEPDSGDAEGESALPRDEVERQLADLWAEFFARDRVGVTENFFTLGGNSLLAVRLMARIRARTGRVLPLAELFARPTIRHLADLVRDTSAPDRRAALVPIRTGGDAVPVFFVHPVGGDVLCYSGLADRLGPGQPFYGLQVPDVDPAPQSLAELAAHYVDVVRREFPAGPYRLGGWSMGGMIALEMARQITATGAEVEVVLAVDIMEPPRRREDAVDETVLLSWLARDLAGLTGRVWRPDPATFTPEADNSALDLLYAEARRREVLPAEVDLDTLTAIADRFSRNFRALLDHQPQPYSGRVCFLRARDGGADVETTQAWMDLVTDGVRLDVPGDHYTVMQQPHLAVLADEIGKLLPPPAADPQVSPLIEG